MEIYTLIAFGILGVVVAGFDFATRSIPNWLNVVVLVAGSLATVFDPGIEGAWSHALHFAIALLAGLLLFRFGVWGGGDAKFYASAAIWFPINQAGLMALFTALSGVLLVVVFFFIGKATGSKTWSSNLPYGVAIALGAVVAKVVSLEI